MGSPLSRLAVLQPERSRRSTIDPAVISRAVAPLPAPRMSPCSAHRREKSMNGVSARCSLARDQRIRILRVICPLFSQNVLLWQGTDHPRRLDVAVDVDRARRKRATPNSSTVRLPNAFIWVCGKSRRELQSRPRAVVFPARPHPGTDHGMRRCQNRLTP
jgi:hypothetical protein